MRTPWLVGDVDSESERLRLFCFPHAGGGASLYFPWREAATDLDIQPINLRGDLDRVRVGTIAELVERLAEALLPFLGSSFALFGHSMGSLVAFELARRLQAEGKLPERLVVSGRASPDTPVPAPAVCGLSDDELSNAFRRDGITPSGVLENPAVLRLFFRATREDIELGRRYRFRPEPLLACPVSTFYGEGEKRKDWESIQGWRAVTTGPWSCHGFEGGHFFPFRESRGPVLATLSALLT